jgi:SOS-response transcriptional repressor LexA
MGRGKQLSADEKSVLKAIFEQLLEMGRSPTTEELGALIGKSSKEIEQLLRNLEMKDALTRHEKTHEITSIYPLSLKPTEHELNLENGSKLFAMCSVDALGAPSMFNKNAGISSRCITCRQKVTVEIKEGKIVFLSHPSMKICIRKMQTYPMASSCCVWNKFFCSGEHADEWIAKNPELESETCVRGVDQIFPRIEKKWKRYGEFLSLR